MTENKGSSLLVIIIDTNPVCWGQKHETRDGKLLLTQCLEAVMVFASSHLMINHKNKLAVIAAHENGSHFLYPCKSVDDKNDESDADQPLPRGERDGKYELFAQMGNAIKEEIQSLITKDSEGEMYGDSLISGALLMALCYIHRLEKEAVYGEKFSSRILTIKGAEDNPSQYMNFMNAVFSAQKQNVVLDACVLDNDSSLLQQACDITGGIFLKIPQMHGLLQYLLWVFLPDPETRSKLVLPPRVQVDYRAACFCHRNLTDIGYVCSVCLSIFCKFSPICTTCQTKFTAPPKLMKRKTKKLNNT